MNASRAQLVREVIRPALAAGEVVLCDRFYDSTMAYQGHGRGLDLGEVRSVINFAVGTTRPDLTLLLRVPVAVSEARRQVRGTEQRDRFEEADREFFQRVERGYDAIAAAELDRVKVIDATRGIEAVAEDIWSRVQPLMEAKAAVTRR
jgi:dTMP kinase